MTSLTRSQPVDSTDSAPLRAEYQRLAYLAGKGDVAAEKLLDKLEARIADIERHQRRKIAADEESTRQAKADDEQFQAAEAERLTWEHLETCKARDAAYLSVEIATAELAEAVKAALIVGAEARASGLRLGYPPGRLPVDELSTFISWKLGRDDGAGLDTLYIMAGLRAPLVTQE